MTRGHCLIIFILLILGCSEEKEPSALCTPEDVQDPVPTAALTIITPSVSAGDVRIGPHSVGPSHVVYVERDAAWDWQNHYYYGGTLHLYDMGTGEDLTLNGDPPFAADTTAHDPSINADWLLARMTEYDGEEYAFADFVHPLGTGTWMPVSTDHLEYMPFTATAGRVLGADRLWYLWETTPPEEFAQFVAPFCGVEVFWPDTGDSSSIINWDSSCDSISISLHDTWGAILARGEVQIYDPQDRRIPLDLSPLGEYQPIAIRMQGDILLVEGLRLHALDTGDGTRLWLDTEIFALEPLTGQWTNLTMDGWFAQREGRYLPPLLASVDRAPLCQFQRHLDENAFTVTDGEGDDVPSPNPYAASETPVIGLIRLRHIPSGTSRTLPPLFTTEAPELLSPVALLPAPWRLVVAWYGTAAQVNAVPGTLVIIDLEAAGLVTAAGELLP